MKKFAIAVLVLLVTAGIAAAKDYQVTKKAGTYEVKATIDKNPPVVGDNNITIAIKDASGKTVTDAKVMVEYGMPAMPGMPAMDYKTPAELKGTEYRAKMGLSMGGSWYVAVKLTKDGKTSTMKFTIDAH